MIVFWIGILIAIIFAYSAIKLGFYHAWTMLFNVLVAVYLAIRVGPALEEFFPDAVSGQYARTLALLATGTGTFLFLHGISYVLLIGQFEVTFPRAVNIIGSGLLGFSAGFLIWSFGTFVFCTTPLCQNQSVKEIGLDTKTFEEAKMQPYLVWWCNFLDKFVGSGNDPVTVEKAIKDLLIKPTNNAIADMNARRGTSIRPVSVIDPNAPSHQSSAASSPEPNTEIPP